MEELIQEFTSTAEDGSEHVLYVYQDFRDAGTRSEPSAQVPGLKRIATADGLSVNRLGKGEYEVVQSGVILRSRDSDAP